MPILPFLCLKIRNRFPTVCGELCLQSCVQDFWCSSIIKLVYLFFDLTYYISNNTMVEIENSRGIIATNLKDNKIKIKEIDKYGNFHKNSKIYFGKIQLLAIKITN